MENEPELIRDQMQETRTALSEKLEALETQVSGTVQNATAAVTETVEAVKNSVTDTVSTVKESVKDAFDLPGHIERHPWAAVLGSVAVGYLGGRMLNGMGHGKRETPPAYSAFSEALPKQESGTNGHGANGSHKEEEEASEKEGWLGGLAKAFGGELDTLKGLGLSAVAGIVRDLVTQSVPGEMGGRLREWMDDLTEKMGAKPFSEPVLNTEEPAPESSSQEEARPGKQQFTVKRETMPRR